MKARLVVVMVTGLLCLSFQSSSLLAAGLRVEVQYIERKVREEVSRPGSSIPADAKVLASLAILIDDKEPRTAFARIGEENVCLCAMLTKEDKNSITLECEFELQGVGGVLGPKEREPLVFRFHETLRLESAQPKTDLLLPFKCEGKVTQRAYATRVTRE